MANEKKKSIEEQYREDISLSDDDTTFATSYLKLSRVYSEILVVGDLFYCDEVNAYEALTRLRALLDISNEVSNDIKKSI